MKVNFVKPKLSSSSSKEDILFAINQIVEIEKEIPPIKNFIISGGNEIIAKLDYARTLARKAERRVVSVADEGKVTVQKNTLSYLNRLSSFFFALSRQNAYKSGITEEPPKY